MARISGGWRVALWLSVCLAILLPLLGVGLRATGLPMAVRTTGLPTAAEAGAHTLVVAQLGPGVQLVRLVAARDDLYVIDGPLNPVRLMAICEGDHSPELRDPPFIAPVAVPLRDHPDLFAVPERGLFTGRFSQHN